MHLPGALVLSLGLAASAVSAKRQQRPPPANNAVLLSSVQSLMLRGGGAKTSHRRVPAVPQLRCVSPRALCSLHAIDVMRCTNQGSSYGEQDVEWSCAASLPAELKLGATDVICEGYASADDPYVLKGSCGVEYTLALTELGERRYPDLARGQDRWFGGDAQGGNNAWAGLFFLVFVAVLAWIVYSACVAASDNNRRHPNPARRYGGGGDGGGGGGDGGGGGGGGWPFRNDPPPPYPGTNNNYKSSSNGGGSSSSSSSSQQQQGWRPGFWTGLASGAAASYLASGRNRDNRNNYGYAPWGSNNYGSGSRWGGGDSWAGPSSSSSSSSRRGGSSSGERHESTGFGSTRRR
ncbi:hypothetical protein ACQRIT_006626 [Beauveria bassiana]